MILAVVVRIKCAVGIIHICTLLEGPQLPRLESKAHMLKKRWHPGIPNPHIRNCTDIPTMPQQYHLPEGIFYKRAGDDCNIVSSRSIGRITNKYGLLPLTAALGNLETLTLSAGQP